MTHLAVTDLRKRFGGNAVLKGVTFELRGPELVGLIGPNGAGKTTLTNILDGAITPESGTVYLNGERIDQLQPYEVARAGLGRTFQVTRSFRRMSVLENLYVPALAMGGYRAEVHDRAMDVLRFLTMDHLRNEYAQALSGGQQKLLELGRCLMLEPAVLFLDEPFAGVHPRLRDELVARIRELHQGGRTFVVVDHDMESILRISRRLVVMARGSKIADGEPAVVRADQNVLAAYAGL